MKKSMVCGLMMSVSMFSIAAYADNDDNALTTKKYVNDGLTFVYGVANGTENGAVKTLQQVVGQVADPEHSVEASGLAGALSDGNGGWINVGTLKQTVDGLQTQTYNGGDGITVTQGTNGNPGTIKVGLPNNAQNGAKYVFQSDGNGGGTWTQMEVVNTWDSSFLTNP